MNAPTIKTNNSNNIFKIINKILSKMDKTTIIDKIKKEKKEEIIILINVYKKWYKKLVVD